MCEKCDEIREKIDMCQRLLWQGLDELTADRLNSLMQTYQRQLDAPDCQRRPLN